MAQFEPAVALVLQHEGAYSNLRGDPGGETHWGWSSAECRAMGIPLPKTEAEAVALYQKYFWQPLYDSIPSQTIANKLFDDEVNQGEGTGIRHLQRALCSAGCIVRQDGVFGPATLRAISLIPEGLLLPWMRSIQYESYLDWATGIPKRLALLAGLANRAAWPDDGGIAKELLAGTYLPAAEGISFKERVNG